MPPRLAMQGISKRFGATQALEAVHLALAPGEVHALMGENGAGKSTLMKILSGAHRPDAGAMALDGAPFAPATPLEARRAGIAMIYQELNLAPHLSAEENIFLGQEPRRWGWVSRAEQRRRARELMAQLQHPHLPLEAPAHTLTMAEQQIVEIARALAGESRILIMDEPTSSLTRADTRILFQVVRGLKAHGISVLYISHFLEECQQLCDRYTVLRDGRVAASGGMAETALETILHHMVGREMSEIYPRIPHEIGDPVLAWRNLAGVRKPEPTNLVLREGEILGIAGLIGAGRTELLRAGFGLDRRAEGEVQVLGAVLPPNRPHQSWQHGLGFLSENRKEEGLMLQRTVSENLTLTRHAPFTTFGFVRRGRERQLAEEWMEKLRIRALGPAQPVEALSGGNQQKVALARLLHHDCRILLLDEPTRGIDVGSKVEIYRWMGRLAAEGKSILFVSSYLPELLGVCDTIAVLCRGRLRSVRPASAWDEESIMAAAITTGEHER